MTTTETVFTAAPGELKAKRSFRLGNKTDQINGIKLLFAMVLLIGGIMEVDMPQPKVGTLHLNCPVIKAEIADENGRYETRKQRCIRLASN